MFILKDNKKIRQGGVTREWLGFERRKKNVNTIKIFSNRIIKTISCQNWVKSIYI